MFLCLSDSADVTASLQMFPALQPGPLELPWSVPSSTS